MNLLINIRNKIIFAFTLFKITGYLSKWSDIVNLWLGNGVDYIVNLKSGLKFKLTHRLDLFTIEEEFVRGVYDVNINQPKIIIDIGAHIGTFSLDYSKKLPSARILAFEPNTSTYKYLEFNVKLNNCKNVSTYNIAVAKSSGRRRFYNNRYSTVSGLIKTGTSSYNFIKTLSLKDIMNKYDIKDCDLLKIDCEGSEYEILLNTSKKVLSRINYLIVEYHEGISDYGHGDLLDVLQKYNFKVVKIEQQKYDENIGVIYAKNNSSYLSTGKFSE